MSEKILSKKLKDELFLKRPHAGQVLSDEQWLEASEYCQSYKAFLQKGKTEREACDYALDMALSQGFVEYKAGQKYKVGDKIYVSNRGKALILAVIGEQCIGNGMRILASHIDSPRLDLKQNPLYEDCDIALLKTHYYGGIKKYQWAAIPLALHGVIIRRDGEKITVCIGENADEPRFCVTDLLPHLANDQSKRKLSEGILGEELNVLIGSRPFREEGGSELVKLGVLQLLFEKYGMIEEDFLSAELELVPAFPVSDVGIDHALIGGYGQDDRVCAYTSLTALFDVSEPKTTCAIILADKEETGSDGNTGLQSAFFEYFAHSLCESSGISARDCLAKSECLSADVNAAFDPTWPGVMEKNNASYLNRGVVVTKYTGSRGKSGTSDASAEFTAKILSIFREANVLWQTGELGKVDEGGGGTVAKFLANLGMDVIDVGVPLLSMHSPFEIAAKTDIWMAHRAFSAFLNT